MPTPKQMEQLAAEAVRKAASPGAAPDPATPAILNDPRAGTNGLRLAQRHLSEIQRHVLRVSCRRCDRTVEIQTADAVRLYGGNAVWKHVAQRLPFTQFGLHLDLRMAPKHHPTPLSGSHRKALKEELGKARARRVSWLRSHWKCVPRALH